MNPQIVFLLNKSLESLRNSNLESAELYLNQVLKLHPSNPHALRLLGVVSAQRKDYPKALMYLNNSLKALPKNSATLNNLGNVFLELKQYDDALDCYVKSLKIDSKNYEAWSNKGNALFALKRYEEAVDHHDKALSLQPDYAEGWSNKGNALKELKRFDEAIAHFDQALSLKAYYPEAWTNKGNTLHQMKRFDEAIIHYDQALSLQPDNYEVWSSKGASLHELKRFDEAIAHYDQALSLNPDYREAWLNKGSSLHGLWQFDEAIANYDKALSLKPDYHEAWSNKASALNLLKRDAESAKCFQKALEFNVEDSYLLGQAHHQMMIGCDWSDYEKNINEIFHLANEGRKGADPFGFQGIASSEELLKKCAEIYSSDKFPALGNLSKSSQYKHHKIRIGYLCGEFRNQATSILMTRVWELHNKSKFEIFAFDNGWDDGSDHRQRIASAFSNIFDISKLSDLDAAKLIQHNEIDILVNLNGFFGLARQGIFSYKPAPVQVNYLGFPGTMGIQYMDYIIADKVVIPEESKIHYVEKLAYLPNSYQANDDMRTISDRKFSKAELGLPEDAFVFACFNNNYKITPTVFDSWVRILSLVQGSVLWLLADNPWAKDNLIKEALARGIDSSRLVFAERLPISEHLARHDLADLFLDTLPYNAHTTCSDALWAGLPVLTLMGHTFPGRVSASLLSAVGLSELVTHTQEEYEALAVELAMNPQKLADIKAKLAKNRLSTPLFDTPLFTKNIEAAYMKMMERYQADLEPDHLFVT
jgi:protein O-GlcNAc transferase